MPIIRIELLAGRPAETKAELIRRVTDAVVDVLGSEPSRVRVLLQDVPPENWGIAGSPANGRHHENHEPTEN